MDPIEAEEASSFWSVSYRCLALDRKPAIASGPQHENKYEHDDDCESEYEHEHEHERCVAEA